MASKKKAVKRTQLNDERLKKLFRKLKSVAKVAAKVGASYVGVRRNLIRQGVKATNLA